MEKANDLSSSFSWWSDSHNRPHQSPWLQSTLSDLDEKVKRIVSFIQDEGDSFAERAEKFYKRRPELLKILHELRDSYRCLAKRYDRVRSPSFTSLKRFEETQPSSECKFDHNFEGKGKDGIELNGKADEDINLLDGGDEEKIWSGLRLTVSKLIEDNRRQQAELIRRNDEKREVIKQLRAQISILMEENRTLANCLSNPNPNPSFDGELKRSDSNSNNFSKLKGLNCIGNFRN